MVEIHQLQTQSFKKQSSYRLISSKYPPVALFDDVASNDEFDAIYRVQAITNPRLSETVGNMKLLPKDERPFGIPGASYAIAPFAHVNSEGSRFSGGAFGILYAAIDTETAIAETRYHQQKYFQNLENLDFDNLVMRALKVTFSAELVNIYKPEVIKKLHHPDDYSESQKFGNQIKKNNKDGITYGSVRNENKQCFAIFTPKLIHEIKQTDHYDYKWDGSKISHVIQMKKTA